MLSTGEYDYIKNLTITYYDKGYENYLCITNNPTSYTNNNVYDVVCYYSEEDMSITNSQLVLPANTQKCEFDSNNYGDNNTIDKLVCETTTGTVSLSTKEYILLSKREKIRLKIKFPNSIAETPYFFFFAALAE